MKGTKQAGAKSIAAIAQECGVSLMTVSRALRNSPSVRSETREQILKAAEKIGYHRPLKTGRPPSPSGFGRSQAELVIGLFDRNVALFYTEILTSLEQNLAANGHDCVVRTCLDGYKQFMALKETLRTSDAAGTFVLGHFDTEQLCAILDVAPKALLLDNPGDPEIDLPYSSISFDNTAAARIAVRHLLKSGRKRILLVNGFPGHYFSREISVGYREALEGAGIGLDGRLMLETDFTSDQAYEKVKEALDDGVRFDGVFTNDEMACGVYRAVLEIGLKIPGDVAVCGCDGLPVGRQIIPRLTTVKLDYYRLGTMAVEHMLKAKSGNCGPCRIKLLPELEIRESA